MAFENTYHFVIRPPECVSAKNYFSLQHLKSLSLQSQGGTITEIKLINLACCVFSVLPEMVDNVGHTEERQDEGTGPAVTLPDEVAARVPGLAQPLLSNGSV